MTLLDDMKLGVARVKKIIAEQKNNYNQYQYPQYNQHKNVGRTYQYSMDRPPQLFIRRAVESSDEDEEKERPRHKHGDKKKRYKEVVKEKDSLNVVKAKEIPKEKESPKVVLNHDDFPTLG